ncbi:tyrosine-type recombinase/integrase [Sulfurimonas sp. MAG313]|nr:tyrosine-type recombinase/integrase [Sulfurimonas sp. MAG313]MDF1881949.1 tyrosine-type recombinase/integrase [Sulfurimonas sp. MAG313]
MKTLLKSYKLPFLDYLSDIRGYSDLTVKTYALVIDEAFKSIIYEENILNLNPYRLKIASLNAKTISKKLSALRSFVKFMQERGEKLSLKGDSSIKVPKTLPKPLSHTHIMQALSQADEDEELIVVMLYTLGLRISELSSVELDKIENEWIIVRGKGNKQRQIPLLKITSELIQKYKNKKSPTHFLFEKNGAKLSENTLRYKLTKLFKKIGIHATPHMLRHSYATSLLNNDARIADVSELLGHSSMATTQIYTKLSSSIKMKNYQAAHPLALGEK